MENDTKSESDVLTPNEQISYNNHSMHQKFQTLVITKMSDVQFVFEFEGDVVKIPAHKVILSESSPVFDKMFNGDLKEQGDVKIVDASPDAFKEFLQFFYEDQVKLTMDNIADVLNLANKYDVAVCLPICIEFLKANLVVDEVLWAQHLALKFQLNDLKVFCEEQIQKNIENVMEMFELGDNGEVSLLSNPNKRFIPDKDVKTFFVRVFATSKKVLSSQSAEIKQFHEKDVSFTLSEAGTFSSNKISNKEETIYFQLDGSMLLTDVHCSKIYYKDDDYSRYREGDEFFSLIIMETLPNSYSKAIFRIDDICVDKNKNHLKLENPITLKSNYIYSIILKPYDDQIDCVTNCATIPDESVKLTKKVNISFPKNNGQQAYTHSLIHRLNFQEILEE